MSNDRGRNRFTSELEPARRAALESLLLPVDHPDLWSDDALERKLAGGVSRWLRDTARNVTPPAWAQQARDVDQSGHPVRSAFFPADHRTAAAQSAIIARF
jgi:hypothetical protein